MWYLIALVLLVIGLIGFGSPWMLAIPAALGIVCLILRYPELS